MEPENETFYRENLRKALEECGTLDAEFQSVLDKISCRQIVVSHCAFGYLCRDYGLEQAALEGYSAFSDPSPAQMVKIIEFIKKNQISVIFTASNENSKGAEAIARETGVKISVLHPLGTLTQAQMDSNADYFSLMRENLEALKTL